MALVGKLRALIFDLDGLLVDTETVEYQAWCSVYEDHGTTLPLDLWASALGLEQGSVDFLAHLEERVGQVDRETLLAERIGPWLIHSKVEEPMLGAKELVLEGSRRGLPMAVCSSSGHDWVDSLLDRIGIREKFDQVVAREDAPRAKPFPDLYNEALKRLGVEARCALAFEDSPNGVLAAQAAGIRTIAVPNTVTSMLDLSHADRVVGSLTEVDLDEIVVWFSR